VLLVEHACPDIAFFSVHTFFTIIAKITAEGTRRIGYHFHSNDDDGHESAGSGTVEQVEDESTRSGSWKLFYRQRA
jgi:hypothetical protein